MPLSVAVGAHQSQGECSYQEDRYLHLSPYANGALFFAGVFDGHSGPRAADYARKHLARDLAAHDLFGRDMRAAMAEAMAAVDRRFLAKLADGGSTAVMAVAAPVAPAAPARWRLSVGNAGDSRCVLGTREGAAVAMSADHKPDAPGERARIEASGHTVEEQVVLEAGKRVKIARIDGQVACSRGLGDADFKDYGLEPAEQAISCVPDVRERDLDAATDWFLILGCDGLWDVVSSEDAVKYVAARLPKGPATNADAESAAKALVVYATKEHGSADNTTAVVVVFNWS
eukprot:m51a1_g16 hypothetical protein (287) ;mRNA; f:82410-83796